MTSEPGEISWRRQLGRKVSLRFRVHGDPAHPWSEAVGVVQTVDGDGTDARLTVVTRRGEARVVAVRDVVACKLLSAENGR
ncbi:MAG: hypothetical protein ABR575_08440 [Actinomycetota bacterium]